MRASFLRLTELAADDPSSVVRAAAEKALDQFAAIPVCCLVCGGEGAKLVPDPADPHSQAHGFPVFCGEACAVEWALEAVAIEIDAGAIHLCEQEGGWRVGARSACATCIEADAIGQEPEPPPEPRPKVVEPRRRWRRATSPRTP